MDRRATALVGAGLLLLTGLFTGCSGSSDGARDSPKPSASATSGSAAPSGSASGDLSAGGTCAGGEAITLATPGAQVVLNGPCGVITITGAGVRANIDQATKVEVKGDQVRLIAKTVPDLVVEGKDANLNVDLLDKVQLSGATATVVNNTSATQVTISGEAVTFNGADVGTLTLNGNKATVVLSGELTQFSVTGNENTVNWTSGAKAPTSDTGANNTYTHP